MSFALSGPKQSGSARAAEVVKEERAEFLTFRLGSQEFGVDILKVQEIRGYDDVTRIPDTPEYIRGVINLRGTVVPVIDMRLKFRLQAQYDAFTVMIVLNLTRTVVAIVVDGVSDVVAFGQTQLKPPPEFGRGVDARFLTGIGMQAERMVLLLDIEALLQAEVLGVMAATG
jgi:purine-binding chemotaxis protein CheW